MSFKPVYILIGEDSYLISRELKKIKAKLPQNYDKKLFSAKEVEVSTMVNACHDLSLFSELKWIIVSDIDKLKKEELDIFLEYFKNPNPQTILVFITPKIDKRLKAWIYAKEQGWIIELKPPYANQMVSWILMEAKHLNITLSLEAAEVLVDIFGNQLAALISSLETLMLYCHPRTNIEFKDVEAIVGSFGSEKIFELSDQIGKRDFAHSAHLLDHILSQGENPVYLLVMLQRHFRLLLKARECLEERFGEGQMAGVLGVHPFFAKNYLMQAKSFSVNQLKDIFRSLAKMDCQIKSGQALPVFSLKKFVMDVALPSRS
ncbi:MAG: DNA polymerase III subunit delta [Deltaproteobacteria bacterium RIFCSPLOWO2_12_FULL_40_28]|nr:MAG: DNA polymerase III subunit delta [Deltaproteobacteria bacterium RIFCSPHIGHO2_02_FULL_40_28]OGQ18793.1 MAG: DNA polymerase III subunit delta [Deltaproteobacteria bacterium RIFCSPHIGHO2_12_FULL_40_32]OGQ40038.1 MAG: DNA polymerase III subunit delta [Deltaproteobacteria bacterium RIFCSPLOWO2_02_FULL_40_36]OGQ53221.1 MAG: DNA polymerase III subunit delta [Deltaproteobacteria bacterium RIFCSPLOWO2_12_FULL_40_28]